MFRYLLAVCFLFSSSSNFAQSKKPVEKSQSVQQQIQPDPQFCEAVLLELDNLEKWASQSLHSSIVSRGQSSSVNNLQTALSTYSINLNMLIGAKCNMPNHPFSTSSYFKSARLCNDANERALNRKPMDTTTQPECDKSKWVRDSIN